MREFTNYPIIELDNHLYVIDYGAKLDSKLEVNNYHNLPEYVIATDNPKLLDLPRLPANPEIPQSAIQKLLDKYEHFLRISRNDHYDYAYAEIIADLKILQYKRLYSAAEMILFAEKWRNCNPAEIMKGAKCQLSLFNNYKPKPIEVELYTEEVNVGDAYDGEIKWKAVPKLVNISPEAPHKIIHSVIVRNFIYEK